MHAFTPARFIRMIMLFTFIPFLILGVIFPHGIVLAAGTPIAMLDVPASGFIGETMAFTVSFDNTSASDAGYGPYIDLALPAAGADGAGTAQDDGISFTSAFYQGTQLTPVIAPFMCTGSYVHPLTKQTTSCTPDTQIVILQPPFGSFAAAQPPAVITVNTTVSNLADVNMVLAITAQSGFYLGNDALDNPATDAPIIGAQTSATFTPVLFKLTKIYLGPEDETATGPNFQHQYRVLVDVAKGQTITNLDLSDVLPSTMQFVSVDSVTTALGTPTVTIIDTPSTTAPGGTLTRRIASVTGTAGEDDAVMVFSLYVPRLDASGTPIIDPLTANDALSENNARTSGSWTPVDTRDTTQTVSIDPAGPEHTLYDKAIAIQKHVINSTDVITSPGDVLEYTLDVQISDYFALNGLVVKDTFSDGQHFDSTFAPQLHVNGNTFTLPRAAITAANYTVAQNFTGATANPSIFTIDPVTNDGTTNVTFRLSDELLARGQDGNLVGGCVSATGAGFLTCPGDGPTTAHITFRTIIQNQFADTYPSGEPNVNVNDKLRNDVTVNGNVLHTIGLTPTGFAEDDESGVNIFLARDTIKKSVYAINGDTFCPPINDCSKAVIEPGDTVTYRLQLDAPFSSVERLKLVDFLPLPLFDVDDSTAPTVSHIGSFAPTVSADAPPAGTAKFGPTDTIYNQLNVSPTLTNDAGANSVTFDYGTFEDPTNQPGKIDILFTVTASLRSFEDQLFLNNQLSKQEGSTNNGNYVATTSVQVKVNEPKLNIRKGIVAASNPAAIFSSTQLPAGVTMSAGAACGARQTGIVTSTNLPNTLNSDVSGIDANDQLMYAIVIENTGSGSDGAFDVKIKDSLPAGLRLVSGSVCVTDGTGAVFTTSGDLFGSGLELADPGPTTTPLGAIDPGKTRIDSTLIDSGRNIAIITYLATTTIAVTPGQTLINTATLFNYGSGKGGADFTVVDQTDTAQATIATPQASKVFVASSESDTSDTAIPPRVTIGEVVRYRLAVQIPEGTSGANVQFYDNLPAGVTFLNDGTAKVAFVSDGGLSSSTVSGVPNVNANSAALADVPSSAITGVLPDAAVSNSKTTNNDTYTSSTGVYFSLGTLTNADSDTNSEYVIVDFNAIVDNTTTGNNAGITRTNAMQLLIGGTPVGNIASVDVRIAEPALTLTKIIVDPLDAQGDAGDTVTYRVTYKNATSVNVSSAFDTNLIDTLPDTLVLNVSSVAVTPSGGVAGITNNSTGNSVAVSIAKIAPGGSVQVDYTATIKNTVASGQQLQNTAQLTYTSLPGTHGTTSNPTGSATSDAPGAARGKRTGAGGINKYNTSKTAMLSIFLPMPTKSIIATSEASTTGSNLTIGEIVRYRVTTRVAEGSSLNFQIHDTLPTGLTFLNDGTAKVALASTDPGLSSSAFNGAGLQSYPKNETNLVSVTPTFVIPTSAITGGTGAGGAFQSGDDPTFSFADLDNTDSDADQEFVVIEFNALVDNAVSGSNDAGDTRDNTITVRINGSDIGTSAPVLATIVEPHVTLTKTATVTPPVKPNDTVMYTIVATNSGAAMSATAFDVRVQDALDNNLTLQNAIVTVKPAYANPTNSTSAPNVDITIDQLKPGDAVTIQVTAKINAVSANGQTVPNIANVFYTSLPSTNGTTTNVTGSATPGAPGSDTGERNASGGVNDYTTSASAPLAFGSIGDTVWYDSDGNGALNGSEQGLSGVTVKLSLPGPNSALGDGDDVTVTTTTNASGQYQFTGLPAAAYRVSIDTTTLPTGFTIATYDPDGGDDSTASVALGIAQQRSDADFGYTVTPLAMLSSIGDLVWMDFDGNGTQNNNEPGLGNVAVNLRGAGADNVFGTGDDILYAQVTTANGTYNFSGLSAGQYRVSVDTGTLPLGLAETYDLDGGADSSSAIILAAGQTRTDADFGYRGTGSIGDRVWDDRNGDGKQDAGEPGVGGVTMRLAWPGPDGVLDTPDDLVSTTTTTSDGTYHFNNLPANIYRVTLAPATLVAGMTPTYDSDGGLDNLARVSLAAGQQRDDVDFGYAVSAIDLVIAKRDNGAATAGSTVIYTLVYTNAGNFATAGVVIHETVPDYTSFNAAASTSGWACAGTTSGNICTLSIGALQRSAQGQVLFAVTTISPVSAGVDHLSNTASITDNGARGADSVPANNSSSVTTPLIAAPDLQLRKSDNNAKMQAGSPITYTLTYTNSGTQNATGVVISETVPTHTTFSAAASTAGWVCAGTTAGSACTFAVGALDVGKAGAVQFVAIVDAPLPTSVSGIANTASIADDGANGVDPTNNNVSSVTTSATPTAITLVSFLAARESGIIIVRWMTAQEQRTLGFRLYRSSDGTRQHAVLVTPTIIGGKGRSGASYSWTDSDIQAETTYVYWLEEVDMEGHSSFYGPATERITTSNTTGSYQFFIPLVSR